MYDRILSCNNEHSEFATIYFIILDETAFSRKHKPYENW